MSDTRIDKIRASWPDDDIDAAHLHLRFIESAGLLVVDPADPAVIARVIDALGDRGHLVGSATARAVLAALGGDR